MLRFDAIILDFDGVLIESVDVKTRAFVRLYAPFGPEIESKVVAYHLAHGGVSRFEKFRYFHNVLLGEPLSAAQEARLAEEFSSLVEDAVVAAPWVRGAREFVETHHGALSLFVASGTPEDELKRIIERREMADYFVDVKGAPATKGEILSDFIRRHRLRRERTLMVGDARADYEGAREARVAFAGIAPARVDFFPPDVPILPDMTGLPALLLASTTGSMARSS